jgi:hypothetical protein
VASGSVTASVAPDYGFKVESQISGSQLTGSLQVSGSIYMYATSGALMLESSSNFFGEGRYLRNIPRSALTEDALISTEIKSGSVTASVAPDYGFKVITAFTSSLGESGAFTASIASQFTGSISVSGSVYINDNSGGLFIESSSFIYAEGTYLRNIPKSALTEDALLSSFIVSGSVTASVNPDE